MIKKALKSLLTRFGYYVVHRSVMPRGVDLLCDVARLADPHLFRTVFDVGAHEGQTSLEYSRSFPGAKIYGFEPVAASFEIARERTRNIDRILLTNIYSGALLIHQKLTRSYSGQVFSGMARLGLNGIFEACSTLTAVTASWSATFGTIINAILFRNAARDLVNEGSHDIKRVRREMFAYTAPLIPGIVFIALQSQLNVFIISAFGQDRSIAEVAALGRLGQILAVFATFYSVIVGPYIAKLPRAHLPLRYLQILLSGSVFGMLVVATCSAWPKALLWILGSKYAHLEEEVLWSVAAWAISFVGGIMWSMHAARKWVFWWGTISYILTLVIIQTLAAALLDLSNTKNILYFSIISNTAVLAIHITTGVIGFRKMCLNTPT